MRKREWGAESNGKLSAPIQSLVKLQHELAVENLPSAELQPRFLRLQLRTCPWAEHDDDDDDDEFIYR